MDCESDSQGGDFMGKKKKEKIYLIGYDDTMVGYAYTKSDAKKVAKARNYRIVPLKRTKQIDEILTRMENGDTDMSVLHGPGGVLMFADEEEWMLEAFHQFELDVIEYMVRFKRSLARMKFSNDLDKVLVKFLNQLIDHHMRTYAEDDIFDDEYYYNWQVISEWFVDNVIKGENNYV